MRIEDLVRLDHRDLDELYAADRALLVPGVYRGWHLCWVPRRDDAPRWIDPVLTVGFRWMPFGIDFDRGSWFFGHTAIALGRFRMEEGASRWRPGRTMRLHYDVGKLPRRVRAWLYDEVKPLEDGLCLGLGGLNVAGRGGERFYFALTRRG